MEIFPSSFKLGFLGAGKMAEALIKGIIDNGVLQSSQIMASDKDEDRLKFISKNYNVSISSNSAVSANCEALIIAVKPQNFEDLLAEVADRVGGRLVISIAAGISIAHLYSHLPDAHIVRVMPNTPALVGKAISAFSASANVSDKQKAQVEGLLGAVGQIVEVEETDINAVTAISGSGPAYFYYFVEALTQAALNFGLDEKIAYKLATSTFIGSAQLLEESGKTAKDLRKMVTSPGGTTQAAIEELNENNFFKLIDKAAKKAKLRAEVLKS